MHKQALWASGNGLGLSSPSACLAVPVPSYQGKLEPVLLVAAPDQQLQAPSGPDTKGIPNAGHDISS